MVGFEPTTNRYISKPIGITRAYNIFCVLFTVATEKLITLFYKTRITKPAYTNSATSALFKIRATKNPSSVVRHISKGFFI